MASHTHTHTEHVETNHISFHLNLSTFWHSSNFNQFFYSPVWVSRGQHSFYWIAYKSSGRQRKKFRSLAQSFIVIVILMNFNRSFVTMYNSGCLRGQRLYLNSMSYHVVISFSLSFQNRNHEKRLPTALHHICINLHGVTSSNPADKNSINQNMFNLFDIQFEFTYFHARTITTSNTLRCRDPSAVLLLFSTLISVAHLPHSNCDSFLIILRLKLTPTHVEKTGSCIEVLQCGQNVTRAISICSMPMQCLLLSVICWVGRIY